MTFWNDLTIFLSVLEFIFSCQLRHQSIITIKKINLIKIMCNKRRTTNCFDVNIGNAETTEIIKNRDGKEYYCDHLEQCYAIAKINYNSYGVLHLFMGVKLEPQLTKLNMDNNANCQIFVFGGNCDNSVCKDISTVCEKISNNYNNCSIRYLKKPYGETGNFSIYYKSESDSVSIDCGYNTKEKITINGKKEERDKCFNNYDFKLYA